MPVVGERTDYEEILEKIKKKIRDIENDKEGWSSWLETVKLHSDKNVKSRTIYAAKATPVSNTSVVNFRIPSEQASTSEMALVMILPIFSLSSSALEWCISVLYRICFILRLI